jgi:hypothetical protein
MVFVMPKLDSLFVFRLLDTGGEIRYLRRTPVHEFRLRLTELVNRLPDVNKDSVDVIETFIKPLAVYTCILIHGRFLLLIRMTSV